MSKTTVLSSWGRAIRRALDAAGVDSARLFAEAGLDIAALADPDARYPLANTTRLWALAVEETGDPAFGLAVATQVSQTTFHALGYRSEEHTSELQSLMRISYAVFCLKKKNK